MWTKAGIDAAVATFQQKVLEMFGTNKALTPLALILGTRHPDTGAVGAIQVVAVWDGDFSDNTAHDAWSMQIRTLAKSVHAIGLVHVAEAWVVSEDVDIKAVVDHPDRKEALHMRTQLAPSTGVDPTAFIALIERGGDGNPTVGAWASAPVEDGEFDFAAMLPKEPGHEG